MPNELETIPPRQLMVDPRGILDLVRPEVNTSYLQEALDVMRTGRTRPVIGSIWNCVIDDLRNKVLFVGADIFSREISLDPPVKTYEDFQERVTDFALIDGSYKLGILDKEGYEMMKQALKQRHIFDGHPRSTQPDPIKTMSFINDCIKYVLSVPPPVPSIDIHEYMDTLRTATYDKNEYACTEAFKCMSPTFQNQLLNIMFSEYVEENTDITTQGNIEFAAPILWAICNDSAKSSLSQRFEKIYIGGDSTKIQRGFNFIRICKGVPSLSTRVRTFIYSRLLEDVEKAFGSYVAEAKAWDRIEGMGMAIPTAVLERYCKNLVLSILGNGYGYSWGAERSILKMSSNFNAQIREIIYKILKHDDDLHRYISINDSSRVTAVVRLIDGPGLVVDIRNSLDELLKLKDEELKKRILSKKF